MFYIFQVSMEVSVSLIFLIFEKAQPKYVFLVFKHNPNHTGSEAQKTCIIGMVILVSFRSTHKITTIICWLPPH